MFNKELMLTMFSIGDDMLFPDFNKTIYSKNDVHTWTPEEDCFVIADRIDGFLYIGDTTVISPQSIYKCLAFYCPKGTKINSSDGFSINAFPLVKGGGLKKNLRRALDV